MRPPFDTKQQSCIHHGSNKTPQVCAALPCSTPLSLAILVNVAAMATEYQWNAALSWPLNPSGHFTNHTGHTNASHISSAALVYVPGKMPPPWPYLVASAAISWLLAVIAWTTESIRDLNAPKKPSVLRHARQPSIIYSALRTLSLVITSARAPATRTIPSSFTTAAVAFSLISNLLDWEDVFDMYSWVVMVCTTTLFGLLAYEYSLTLPLLQSRDAASSYGSGRMALVGGACIRQLQRGETCKALQMLGCAEGGVGAGFVLHTVAVSYTQYWAQFVGVIGIVVALFYFAKFYMRRGTYLPPSLCVGGNSC